MNDNVRKVIKAIEYERAQHIDLLLYVFSSPAITAGSAIKTEIGIGILRISRVKWMDTATSLTINIKPPFRKLPRSGERYVGR